jgi:hypothetical protein
MRNPDRVIKVSTFFLYALAYLALIVRVLYGPDAGDKAMIMYAAILLTLVALSGFVYSGWKNFFSGNSSASTYWTYISWLTVLHLLPAFAFISMTLRADEVFAEASSTMAYVGLLAVNFLYILNLNRTAKS